MSESKLVDHGFGVWVATYPSGKRVEAIGQLVVGVIVPGTKVHPAVFSDGVGGTGRIIIFDPRAVVRNSDGVIVYLGRDTI